jgi:NAD-dependent deacetylase
MGFTVYGRVARLPVCVTWQEGHLDGPIMVTQPIQERVRAGDSEPGCAACGGMLKPTTVSFGQPMPAEPLARAERLLRQARLCLVVGSSLVVYPAAALPELTLDAGGSLAVVNATETHLDPLASLVSRQPAGALLGEAARLVRREPV